MPSLSVLQRFIPTKSGYNHTVRSVYTVDGCSVQKCISPFLLSDEEVSMVKRTATFEVNDPMLRHRTFYYTLDMLECEMVMLSNN